ncbi:MAG TPA: 2-oxoacid:acceptor oxidoreductase family protein [Gammaproteobacteria bacterium]|nr:2-oxoacid:acceptor oxidoreductase family protein [Gammaproteobacteria bacterium]
MNESQIEIRLSGSGGQGILLAGQLLGDALTLEKKRIAQSQSYEPTSRGGLSRCDLVAGIKTADYPLASALDYLVILDRIALNVSDDITTPNTLIVIDAGADDEQTVGNGQTQVLPLLDTARACNDIRSANMVALGALLELSGICRLASLDAAIREGAPAKLVKSMIEAVHAGQALIQATA